MRVFGVDPGSGRTGYGCVETGRSKHRLIACGAIATPLQASFADKLFTIHQALAGAMATCHPDCVAIENLFHAANVRSALRLGHVRGVAILAAVEAGLPIAEYSPAEIKRAVTGYGRAEKQQVQHMVQMLLGLDVMPASHDAADALAVAICHAHLLGASAVAVAPRASARTWRQYRP